MEGAGKYGLAGWITLTLEESLRKTLELLQIFWVLCSFPSTHSLVGILIKVDTSTKIRRSFIHCLLEKCTMGVYIDFYTRFLGPDLCQKWLIFGKYMRIFSMVLIFSLLIVTNVQYFYNEFSFCPCLHFRFCMIVIKLFILIKFPNLSSKSISWNKIYVKIITEVNLYYLLCWLKSVINFWKVLIFQKIH